MKKTITMNNKDGGATVSENKQYVNRIGIKPYKIFYMTAVYTCVRGCVNHTNAKTIALHYK